MKTVVIWNIREQGLEHYPYVNHNIINVIGHIKRRRISCSWLHVYDDRHQGHSTYVIMYLENDLANYMM